MKKEREMIQLTPEESWTMIEILDLKKKCMYCGKKIKKGDKFSIFNKPDRVACESILCLSALLDEEENDKIMITKESLQIALVRIGQQDRFPQRKYMLMKQTYVGIGECSEWSDDYQEEGVEELFKLLKEESEDDNVP